MRITVLLHDWLIDAVDNDVIADEKTIVNCIKNRNRGLLHPTTTPTREIFEHIDRFMKCRVELDIFLYNLGTIDETKTLGKTLTLKSDSVESHCSIEELLIYANEMSGKIRKTQYFKEVAEGMNVRTFLIREGAEFKAWLDPRGKSKGQGKNINEFLRVLYRADKGDESGGYLLVPGKLGYMTGFRVFPGQMLLKTITFLAWQNKREGMLMLQDVEEHFAEYGIDFSSAVDARPQLVEDLIDMGLLTGSPDAGSSVSVANPYNYSSR
jgi:hypothetical protein